jgi:hypothetical protein
VREKDFFSDPEVFLANHLLVSEYYDLDSPSLYYDMYNIEAEALGQRLVWMPGTFPEIDGTQPLIKSPKDLDRIKPPNPDRNGRMPFIKEVYKRAADLGLKPSPRFCSPFTLAANIRGLENLLLDILTNQGFADRLFDFLVNEVTLPWIETLRTICGKDCFSTGADALASLPITNLDIIRDYALAPILKIRKTFEHVGVTAWWGERFLKDPEELFQLKIKGYPTLLKGYDPDVHQVGPEKYAAFAKAAGVRLSLGVDSSLLKNGPISTIIKRVQGYVAAMQGTKDANLFLNEITKECLSAHVHAAVQAARHFVREMTEFQQNEDVFRYQKRDAFRRWLTVKELK